MIVTRFVYIHPIQDAKYVLVNSLSGAVDLVEQDVVDAFRTLRKGENPNMSPEMESNLRERGYLFDSRAEEEEVVERLVAHGQHERAATHALAFMMIPTMSCNLRCPYCFEPHKLHETSQVMSVEQVELAFQAVDEIRAKRTDMPLANIHLFGGEPLLPITESVVELILQRTAERDLGMTITTNGTHTARFLDMMRPHRERLFFQITMDGIKEIHDTRRITAGGTGTFDQITKNIGLLVREGFTVEVRMNLNEDNVDGVPEFLEFVKTQDWHLHPNFRMGLSPVTNYTGLGGDGLLAPYQVEDRVRSIVPEPLFKEVRVALNGDFSRLNKPVADVLGESLIEGRFIPSLYYCEAAGALFYCFTPDGLVYPCNQILGDSKWAIGSYDPELKLDPEMVELWQGRNVTNMSGCMECSIAFLCSGGCPVRASLTSGSPMDSYCGTSKKELSAYLDSVAPKLIQLEEMV